MLSSTSLVGTQVGNIRLEAVLGAGGMGEVYLGFDTRLERRVAVKTIRAKYRFEAEMKSRFLREARILSRLEHPAICQVHDLIEGAENDFLIFEYVEGQTLRRLCAAGPLEERRALEIAEKIAQALAAAHRERIVHRDLKPDNIMVTADGGVKVLDFGISRAVRIAAAEEGRQPRLSALLPSAQETEHISPAGAATEPLVAFGDDDAETAFEAGLQRVEGEQVDSAALNELLTAELDTPTATIPATVAAPTEVAPTLLADTEPAFHPQLVGNSAGTDPLTLDADLTQRGFVLGTLRYMSPEQARAEEVAEPSDLYSLGIVLQEMLTGNSAYHLRSSSELASEVSSGKTLPIEGVDTDLAALVERLKSWSPPARPTAVETAERLREVLEKPERQKQRRRRLILAVSAFALLVVVLALVSVLAVKASREAERASREAKNARAVNDFVVALFDQAAPGQGGGQNISVRDLVDRGADQVAGDLGGKKLDRALLQDAIGVLYWRLGLFSQAEAQLRAALDTRAAELGSDDLDLARSRHHLAMVLADRGDFAEAAILYTAALGVYEKDAAPNGELAGILNDFAYLNILRGQLRAAVPLFERAVSLDEGIFGPESPEVLDRRTNLGGLYQELGDYARAQGIYEKALEQVAQKGERKTLVMATLLNNLGIVVREQGDLRRAEELHRRALAILVSIFGDSHPHVAAVSSSLGRDLAAEGKDAEAIAALERALAIQEQAGSGDGFLAIRLWAEIADVERHRGNLVAAAERLRQAGAMLEKSQLGDHPNLLIYWQSLGRLEKAQRELGAARRSLSRAAEMAALFYDADHPKRLAVDAELAALGD